MTRLLSVLLLAFAAVSCAAPAKKRVVLAYLGPEPTVESCAAAVVAGLAEAEWKEGANLVVERVHADGDIAKVPGMLAGIDARRGTDTQVDLVVCFTTQVLAQVCQGPGATPVVATYCYDPLAAGAGKSLVDHLPWVTGVATPPPLGAVLETLRTLRPDIKRIGVVYNPIESGPRAQVEFVRAWLAVEGIELVAAQVSRPRDVGAAARGLVQRGIQAGWKLGDATTLRAADELYAEWNAARLPIVGDHPRQLAQGAAIVVALDFEAAGRAAGRMAAEVLAGAKPGELPIRQSQAYRVQVDDARVRELGLAGR